MQNKVSIQGFAGSFHHAAAIQYFGEDVEVAPCETFADVPRLVNNAACDAGVMAVENSIAGSILPNYHLLQRSGLGICGEVYLRIHQHLLVLPGVREHDIAEVHSHPMALQQCNNFLSGRDWKRIESNDTAGSAEALALSGIRDRAVIAGEVAARLYGLCILHHSIQDEPQNFTRFWILQPLETSTGGNKATLCFHLPHQKGALARALGIIADHGANLSKLQSLPIPGTPWQYRFYADLEWEGVEDLHGLLPQLAPHTHDLTVLGVYQKGILPQ